MIAKNPYPNKTITSVFLIVCKASSNLSNTILAIFDTIHHNIYPLKINRLNEQGGSFDLEKVRAVTC